MKLVPNDSHYPNVQQHCMRLVAAIPALAIAATTSLSKPKQPSPSAFAPLEFLVGSCWAGTFADGKTTDTHCFDWILDRKFIRDNHVVASEPRYEGETTYAWDATAKRVVYRYVSSAGLLLDGTMESQGGQLISVGQYTGEKGPVNVRAVWTRLSDSTYRAESYEKAGDEWKLMFTVQYRRLEH